MRSCLRKSIPGQEWALEKVSVDGSKFKAVNNRDKNFTILGDRTKCQIGMPSCDVKGLTSG